MGTRFRAMLAPINAPTGDGRRFAAGSLTAAPTPFPFEWVREQGMGHDGAVVIGAVQEVEFTDDAVWATGEIFDDVDREEMPRLAEDVAEAIKLISEGVIGPSVDLDSFEGIPVREGTDTEVTWEDLDEAEENGEEVKIELLVTEGRIRAATLVSIPAFMETSRPMELLEPEEPEGAEEAAARTAALVASITVPVGPPVAAFDLPELDGPTQITVDWENGLVYGHIATWGTCHGGFPDVCVTPPRDPRGGEYSWFHRFPVDTQDGGTVWAGRLTVGGRHPGLSLTASATMTAYDSKDVAAYVRVKEDKFGMAIVGPLNPDLSDTAKRVLSRRKVSGDWRDTPDGLSMVELLALSPGPRMHSEPGFPVATRSHNGRQVTLTAALGPGTTAYTVRPSDLSAEVRAAMRVERDRERAATELRAEIEAEVQASRESARARLAEALEIPPGMLGG